MKLNKTQTQKNNNTLFMNLSKKIAATAFMFIAFVTVANAQMSAQQTVSATATIVKPISLEVITPLAFGNIIPNETGTVQITPAGVVIETGAEIAQGQKGLQSAAVFNVRGENDYTYAITLPRENDVILLNVDNGYIMPVTNFNHDNITLPKLTNGSDSFKVGATLHVLGTQPAGKYTGVFTVKVNYN
jgi:hypothetical protein